MPRCAAGLGEARDHGVVPLLGATHELSRHVTGAMLVVRR